MEPVVACSSQHLEGGPSHFAGTFRGTDVGPGTGYNNLPYHNYTHACDAPRLQPIPFRNAVDLSGGVGTAKVQIWRGEWSGLLCHFQPFPGLNTG